MVVEFMNFNQKCLEICKFSDSDIEKIRFDPSLWNLISNFKKKQ